MRTSVLRWPLMVLALTAFTGVMRADSLVSLETELNTVAEKTVSATVRIRTRTAQLSGVMISPEGHILSLKNVGGRGDAVTVILPTGRVARGQVLKRWALQGLALLKVEATDAPYVRLGDSRAMKPGDPVVSLGNAFGAARGRRTGVAVNSGIISGRRQFSNPGLYFEGEAFLTDARINQGSEGGPLVDSEGFLIAINGMPLVAGETNANVSLALPIELVADKLGDIAPRPLQVDLEGVARFDIRAHGSGGIQILEVLEPARRAGFEAGDLIRAVDGFPIRDVGDFSTRLREAAANRLLPVSVYRNGRFLSRWLPLRKEAAIDLHLLGEAYRRAAKNAAPSLVRIHVDRLDRGAALDPNLPQGRQVFQLGDGPFSGVVYRSDGYILTSAFNLAGRIKTVTVALNDGRHLPARVLGTDLGRNITLLKVEATNLPEPRRVEPGTIRVGTTVLALGSTFANGLPTLDRGIVSALNRSAGKAIQIDANLTPGNFGGPCVDLDGRVIGVNIPQAHRDATARDQGTAGGQFSGSGIGFVIPFRDVDMLFRQLKEGEDLEPAFLGIRFKDDSEVVGAEILMVIQEVGLPKTGVTLQQMRAVRTLAELKKLHRMVPTGAAAAGLQPGDVIKEFNGEFIPSWNVLLNSIGRLNAGDEVVFTIERFGVRRKVKAVMGPRGRVF